MAATPGYELLIAAGSSLTGTAIFDMDAEPSNREVDQFLIANQDALERARIALQQDCVVPLDYDVAFIEKQLAHACLTLLSISGPHVSLLMAR